MREVGPLQWGEFKPRLADALVEHLAPIRSNYAEVMKVADVSCRTKLRTSCCRGQTVQGVQLMTSVVV